MPDVRLIDANAFLDAWHGWLHDDSDKRLFTHLIEDAPTIDAVPVVHGRWVHSDGKSIVWYCSECGGKILYNPNPRTYNIKKPKVEQYNKFCRNCGAKMDGGAESV